MNSNPNDDKRLFLLDAYALIYRAYFAFSRNPLINSKGMNVSAISGFTSTLIDLIQKEKPTHLAVVFDSAEETTRAAEFSFYKAHREAMPEDIQNSIPWIRQIIAGFHIPMLEVAGYEADDIIGTIAKQKAATGHVVYMVTPDKDYGQLVDSNIFIYKPGRQGSDVEILGIKEIQEKWEVKSPLQVIDILGMWGDSVDNIPGIPGVGEKTAKKLIQDFGSLEAVLERSSELKGKLRENVEQFREQALVSKMLATIILDVPVEVSDDDLLITPPDKDKLSALFAELEFRSLGRRILGDTYQVNRPAAAKPVQSNGQMDLFAELPNESETTFAEPEQRGRNIHNTPHEYYVADSIAACENLCKTLLSSKEVCFDTETSSLDYYALDVVGLSFSIQSGKAWYVPCPIDRQETLQILSLFKPLFENKSILKIGQNIKFDMHAIRHSPRWAALRYHVGALPHRTRPETRHGFSERIAVGLHAG
jgi:DNA polymerase-1